MSIKNNNKLNISNTINKTKNSDFFNGKKDIAKIGLDSFYISKFIKGRTKLDKIFADILNY